MRQIQPTIIDSLAKNLLSNLRCKSRLWVLCYHSATDKMTGTIPSTTHNLNTLAIHLQLLQYYGFNFVSGLQVSESLLQHKSLPPYPVLVTVDDGFKNFRTKILPFFEQLQVPSIVFITTDYIDSDYIYTFSGWIRGDTGSCSSTEDIHEDFLSLSSDDIRYLGKHPLVEVGAHTCTHPFLTRIPLDEACSEIKRSKTRLEQILNQNVDFFAYPHGDYSDEITSYVARHFALAFTVNRGTNGPDSNPIKLNRYSLKPKDTINSLRSYIFCFYDLIRLFDGYRGK